jgi:TP901 family phage tail tape measure protein
MANAYTQEVQLDADGKPVMDALARVLQFAGEMQKAVAGIGVTTKKDAEAWATMLASNLKMLKQAESDIKTLQQGKTDRAKGFAGVEKAAKDAARAEVNADKQANTQKTIEARVYYNQKQQIAKQEASIEKQLAKEIADFEREQDRRAIASAKEVAAARREAAQASVVAKARGITNPDDARAAKAASDQRLNLLRREREATAANDAEAAKGIASRIAIEKALGTALDGTIRKLNQQAEAERRAQEAADRRFTGQLPAANRLLAPGNVRDEVNRSGDPKSTLVGYQLEQELARRQLQASIGDKNATLEQVTASRQRLELANANVSAAERLVREDIKALEVEQKINSLNRLEQQKAQVALAGQYAREQIAVLGPKEAIRRAADATANAEVRLATASREHVVTARQELELAKAQQREVEKQGKGPLSNIMSPGYAAAAFARTSIYGAAAGAAYGVFNAVQGSMSQVVEMEDELAKLQAIANATDTQLQQLKGAIYSVGETSRFSLVDLAKISQTLAQAGVASGEMEKVLSAVTTLATASGSTPDEAVGLVTSALGSFQLQASESARIADLMTSALNRTKLTVQQTAQAIQYVGATAYEQNITLEQLLATVGAIAQAGVRSGSTIGTGFRQFLVDLQTPSEKLTTQLTAVGLKASDVNVAVRGLPAVLDSLGKAGFGSAQAYQGLETRAAAFYLVAKNNVGTMEQLQIAFAQQGAAAAANERAMNSLSAQWQRFQNILAAGFGESLETPIRIVQDLLRRVSDSITEARTLTELAKQAEKDGPDAYGGKGQTGNNQVDYVLNYDIGAGFNKYFGDLGVQAQTSFLNGFGLDKVLGIKGLGTVYAEWATQMDGAGKSSDAFKTKVAEASEKVDGQAGKISELDKEMSRLITQQDSLKGNTLATNAETASLTARFEGLAGFLTNAKDRYGDLIGAMQRYRSEAVKTQIAYLNQQRSLFGQQADQAKVNATNMANQALRDPGLMSKLTPREKEALLKPRDGANGTVIADAGARLNNPLLRNLSIELGTLATSVAEGNLATTQLNDSITQNTAAGKSLGQRTQAAESALTSFTSLAQADQVKAAPALRAQAQSAKTEAQNRLNNPNTSARARPTLESIVSRSDAVLKGIDAALAPTKAETKADAKAERERKAAEREADKKEKQVSQSDIDKIGLGLGLKLGSGTRTPAEQEALHARGLTPARGFGARTSNHVGGIARDFKVDGLSDAEATRYAATMRAQYKAAGINAQVQFETGRGRNQGSGRHIHVGVAKGAKRRSDNTDEVQDRNQVELAKDQISLDQEDLKNKIKDVAKATTTDTFDAAVTAARTALDKVNAELKPAALDELAAAGIAPGSAQFQLRMSQVAQEIAQNVDSFNQSIADGIVKSAKKQMDAAQTAFDAAVQPAQTRLSITQAQVTGLDAYSLRNKVPDYVKSLANDRTAMAQESVVRAQYAAAPAQIEAQRQTIATATASAEANGVTAQTTADIAAMNVELTRLMANREALAAQLGAGELIPPTASEGLRQAVQAYQQANDLGQSFEQFTVQNLGGAVQEVSDQINGLFTSILTGQKSVLSAMSSFVGSMISYMSRLAAQYLANQAIQALFKLAGFAIGGGLGGTASGGGNAAVSGDAGAVNLGGNSNVIGPFGSFNGGPAGAPINRLGGGEVTNGSKAADSVNTNLAKGEWVINSDSVDSIGPQFMAKLNAHGSKALDSLQTMPKLDMKSTTETNVWVVPGEQQPRMGPNDVRVILTDELLNGDGKRLVEHISRTA